MPRLVDDRERHCDVDFIITDKDGKRKAETLLMPVRLMELGYRAYHTLATTRKGN